MSKYSKQKLIKDILALNKDLYKEIFILLRKNDVKFSQNKNGVFFNLNNITDDLIENIYIYIKSKKNLDNTDLETIETVSDNNADLDDISLEEIKEVKDIEFDEIYNLYPEEMAIINEINKSMCEKNKINNVISKINNKTKKYNRYYQTLIVQQNPENNSHNIFNNLKKEKV